MPSGPSSNVTVLVQRDSRSLDVISAQVRLLYENSNVGVGVTIVAATVLGRLQWGFIPTSVIVGWWLYMVVLSVARFILARRYWGASPGRTETRKWRAAFAAGAGLAGAGWGTAGILLYPPAFVTNQVFLVFVLGGMMLGAAYLLAPRTEAFLAFLVPTGVGPTLRLLFHGDQIHLAMALLAAVFTAATLITTARMHRMVDSWFRLQFENRRLVEDLQAANRRTEALNQELERRVQERTAELSRSNEQLRAEIEQREKMEEELLRARKLESLGVLAGGIAHDFNNFLTVVQGNLELAMAQLNAGEPVQEILEQSAGACRRATFLANQLLTFAKGGTPVRRVTSIAQLVMDAVHLARAGAPTSIAVDIAPDLWSAEVDPGQIGQVLHNLLLNARQAMPEGGIIEVSARNVVVQDREDRGRHLRISIRDYGCGIPADILPRIFDPYFTTKPGGSGLGLATAHAILVKHGGQIHAESQQGEGTVITIDLPATVESGEPAPSLGAELRPGTERILVMDDEDALRSLLSKVLTRAGYEVQTACDGAEAIALSEAAGAAGSRFDAVILDVTVRGGMGGIEAAARLREINPVAKLIVSSGYSDAAVMSEFEGYGFDAVIPKPWTPRDVTDVLRRVLVADADCKSE